MRYKIGDTAFIKVSQPTYRLTKGDVVQIVKVFPFYEVYAVTPLDDLQVIWYFNDDELE